MKRTFAAVVCLFCALSSGFSLEAAETLSIDGRAESKGMASKHSPPFNGPDQNQIIEKLNELQRDHKQILQQLADMKQELYAIKVRASRC